MTLEAVMLHYLDDMDAKITGIQQFLKTQVPEGSKWSSYHRAFEQFFYSSTEGISLELPVKIEESLFDKE